ncbi:MAG: hypothetical protein QOI66_1584 [Myxococcales bacterium]|jgi:uncharacterized membrane-anchored protein|nr:hypothetical protein [Myxococcales bacterium]
MLSKVPAVTVFFWVIKVLCTTVGETASDFLNVNLGLGLKGTAIAAGIALLVALFVQFKAQRYTPAIYWLTVVLISVFGTLVTDLLTDSLGFPLEASTIIFSVALALTFVVWFAKEGTLSIHSIFTRRREAFYWLAILFTFALGTASGDLMAEGLGLGYLATGLIVLGVIATATIAWRLGLDAVLAFWIAYILTRPLGASLGDYLSQPRANGGLGLGATITSAVFVAAILAVVIYLALTQRDFIAEPSQGAARENATRKRGSSVVWQVVGTVVLLLVAGGTGYGVRRSHLRAEAAASVSPSAPLGDLTPFRKIAGEMLSVVRAGDVAGAKSQADGLETAWDNAQARMRPMNPEKWTVMDDAIDGVLVTTRARQSDTAAMNGSLQELIKVMNTLADQKTAPTSAAAAAAAAATPPPESVPKGQPLGNLSVFRKITDDVLRLVRAGNLSEASSRATDLETAWDGAQSRLQAMNREKWTVVDDAIDDVLKKTRAPHRNKAAISGSLERLISVINALDPGM